MTSFDEVVACINKDFDLLSKKCRVSSKTENLILRMMLVYDNDPSKTQANLKKFVHEVYEKNLKVAFMFWANPILLLTIKNMMKNVYNCSGDFDKFFNDHFTIGETNDAMNLPGYKVFKFKVIEFKEMKMKRFDCIFTNPPYEGELHLKIINELTKMSKKVVAVHPARWVEDVLAHLKSDRGLGKKYENLKIALEKIMLFRSHEADHMFGILNNQDLMIGVYSESDTNPSLPIYDNSDRFFDVLKKVLDYSMNVASLGKSGLGVSQDNKIDGIRVELKGILPILNHVNSELVKGYPVRVVWNVISINGYTEDGQFWANANKRNKKTHGKKEGTPIPHSIKFNTKEDAQTFIDLYHTNVVKNIIHMLKYDQNAGHTYIPYFDPKTIKTEDDVLDALGITNEEHRKWLKRKVDDYREKDFIKYGKWIDC